MKRGKISEHLSVGGQPTEDDLQGLQSEGFAGVINLRREGENNQPMDPAAENAVATKAGLKYFHIPVNSSDPQREQVEAIRKALGQIKGPAYVHCQGGGRACMMALLASAPASGYSSNDMLKQAESAGFPVTNPVVADFVKGVLDKS